MIFRLAAIQAASMSAPSSAVPGRVRCTGRHDGWDSGEKRADCHPVTHRAHADHRDRFTRSRHRSLPHSEVGGHRPCHLGSNRAIPTEGEPHADA